MELYDHKASDVIEFLAKELQEKSPKKISLALAKKIIVNSLVYNTVVEEIINKSVYLIEEIL